MDFTDEEIAMAIESIEAGIRDLELNLYLQREMLKSLRLELESRNVSK